MAATVGLLQKEPLSVEARLEEALFCLCVKDKETADYWLEDVCEQLEITPVSYPGVFRLPYDMRRDALIGIIRKKLAVEQIY